MHCQSQHVVDALRQKKSQTFYVLAEQMHRQWRATSRQHVVDVLHPKIDWMQTFYVLPKPTCGKCFASKEVTNILRVEGKIQKLPKPTCGRCFASSMQTFYVLMLSVEKPDHNAS